MHSLENYLRRQSTELLESIIQADCEENAGYPPEVILAVCKVLAERNPPGKSAEEMYREFLRFYGVEEKDL